MRKLRTVRVIANGEISKGAYVLTFKRDFEFIAGQVLGITTHSGIEPRLYSIASGEKDRNIHILYTLKQDGLLTPCLSDLKPADKIYITDVFGTFICQENSAVWIATGTGIAPFASMVLSGLSENKILIYGNHNRSNLYFHDTFQSLMDDRYFPCCSREQNPETFYGRVTDFLERFGIENKQLPFYLCGSAEMVVDVRDILIEKGVPFNNIMSEIFF
ncbi:MAG: oxidoreductase [Bacteroidota bacterium]